MAAEQKIDALTDLAGPIDLCLGCRACETVCPLNVKYGEILEAAKEEVYLRRREQPRAGDRLTWFMMKRVFPYPKRMRLAGNIGRFMQVTGMRKALRTTGIIRAFSRKFDAFEKALPALPSTKERLPVGKVIPAASAPKARAAMFNGCIMDAVMYRTNRLTAQLLAAVGVEVVVPDGQNCCGALHAHQGMMDTARELARRNIEAFERSQADYIVNNAGGCGAALKEYAHLLKDDPEWAERAKAFSDKTRDISELLLKFGPLPFIEGPEITVTYQDSCHLRNVQGVGKEPRALLRQIPGVRLVELEGADHCCGSGGIYNLLHYEESMKILDEKMERVRHTGAHLIVSGNPGCILQMQIGIERENAAHRMRSVHLVELLAERCGITART